MSTEQPSAQPGGVRVVEAGGADRLPRPPVRRIATPLDASEGALARHLWTIVAGRWIVAAIAAAVLAAALAYLVLATPIYRARVTFQIEDRTRSLAGLQELSEMFGERVPAETEIEIIRSRSLLRGVVDALGLDRVARPRRLPLIGPAVARRYDGEGPAPAWLGLDRFGWGGERIDVRRLELSSGLLERRLRLVATAPGRYRVEDEEGRLLVEGEVGKAASGTGGRQRIELFVSELDARPGTQFWVTQRSREAVIDALQRDLVVTEKGKKTGILVMTLDGPDPERTTAILDAIASAYLRQNVERKSAEAAKTLEFLESQLPVVKSALESAQTALNDFQVKKGTVDLTRETTSLLERSVAVDRALQDIEMQRAELRQRFMDKHPSIVSLNEKAAQLRTERAVLNERMREIPSEEADSARLTRDVRSSNELYTVLLNKAQEYRVVKSGTVGNVRILDPAVVAADPEYPRRGVVLALAVVLGLGAGIAGVFLREALKRGAEDADDIETGTGLAVYATVPHSDAQLYGAHAHRVRQGAPALLAAADPGDIAVEHLRSLRTALQFALVESTNNVIAIGGAGPGVGKSFICANLAYVLASADHRVLLVDCDLRRGRLHRAFGLQRRPGVTDVVSGSVQAADAVRKTENPYLDLLTTGAIPPNPSELLATVGFEQLLGWASRHYVYVVIDTPPVLAVTDPTLVARRAGVNLLVLRAGQHPLREIALAVNRYAQSGVKVQGAVLNDCRSSGGRYGKYGRYSRYEYRSDPGES